MPSEKMSRLGTHRSAIRELFEYGRVRRAQIGEEKVFDFSLGNPSVPPPPAVTEGLCQMLQQEPARLHGYTSAQGDPAVREAVAAHIRARFGTSAQAELIYLTVGAAAGLTVALRAILPDDGTGEVVTFSPFFPEYRVFVEQAGGRLVTVPVREQDCQPDPVRLAAALTPSTHVVILNSPNNPTGAVVTEPILAELAAVLRAAEVRYGHPIFLISDEPYRELVYDDGITVPWVPTLYRNTVVCYSFSKSLSLPGERIGYLLISPEAEGAQELYAAVMGAGRALGYVCAPALFQYLLPSCLGLTSDLSVYRANRDRLYTALTSYGYECIRPDGAFYLFVRAPEPDAVRFAERARDFELLLVPSDSFGCPGYVRIAYCVSPETVERSLPAFRSLAAAYGRL